MKDPENALRAFEQATRLSPDDPVVLLNSATCLVNCGMRNEAVTLLNSYKELQQSDKAANLSEEVCSNILFAYSN